MNNRSFKNNNKSCIRNKNRRKRNSRIGGGQLKKEQKEAKRKEHEIKKQNNVSLELTSPELKKDLKEENESLILNDVSHLLQDEEKECRIFCSQ